MLRRSGRPGAVVSFMCLPALCCASQDLALAGDDESNAILSEEFDFAVNEPIPVVKTIGRIHLVVITAQVETSRRRTYRITFTLEVENPDEYDQTVAARIDVLDERGDLMRSGETSGDIEENGSKQLKVAIAIGFTSPDSVKSFRLELQVRDD